jgi:aminopeptidase YwaD
MPPMPPTPPLSPAVAAAVRAVDAAALAADVAFIAQPRNHLESPEHLAAVAAHVDRAFRAAGYATSRQAVRYQGASADNVVAEKRGTGGAAARIVYVCAHYDAVPGSPGADDNASAVAGMLAVARALATARMDATVRFVAFAFEEYGLTGSSTHVQSLPEAEVARIAGVLDLEMIGYVKTGAGSQEFPPGAGMFADEPLPEEGNFIGVVGLAGQPEPLASLRAARPYVPALRTAFLAVPRAGLALMPDLMRSDHAPFWSVGAPSVMITDTADFRNEHYHQATDRLETLDVPFMIDVARWVTAATVILAGAG